MAKSKLMLDLDGVVANFYQGFATYLNENYGTTLDPSTDPTSYDFADWGHGIEQIDFDTASANWMKQDGFGKLPCYDGAQDFLKELINKYDVFIVTARVGDWELKLPTAVKNKIKQNTFDWLNGLGVPANQLYFIKDKIPFCQEQGISAIVEDKLETALKAAKANIHTVLMDRGYNHSKAERLRVYRVYNFNEALAQLEKLLP